MRGRARALLCELHAHTTWSDGELSLGEVVDLYGTAGFDVLCVTDHVLRSDDPWPLRHGRPCLDATNVGAYLAGLERERARALSAYGLLLVPGLELTYNDPDPDRAAHAVAVGLRGLVGMDDGPVAAMETARAAGAAILAAHPHEFGPTPAVPFPTCYFARRWRELRGLVDRVELFNGRHLFSWVAEAGLPAVACGDVHGPEHLPGWTTLVPCEADEEALVDYLRSSRPVFLARLEQPTVALAA
jgi:predicted metal-dependent phosphoesterase TrpH